MRHVHFGKARDPYKNNRSKDRGEQHIVEYDEETRSHKALIYDGSNAIGKWEAVTLEQGQKLREPAPLFVKLEEEIVEQEQALLGQEREENEIVLED